jgi:hypothetical protein
MLVVSSSLWSRTEEVGEIPHIQEGPRRGEGGEVDRRRNHDGDEHVKKGTY